MLKNGTLFACLFLSACTMVGPNYKDPKTRVAPHWLKENKTVREVPVQDVCWWDLFHDENLTALICHYRWLLFEYYNHGQH